MKFPLSSAPAFRRWVRLAVAPALLGSALARGPDVLVVSELLREVPATAQPAAARKVPYFLLGDVERNLGSSVAGESGLEGAKLRTALAATLAKLGYEPTQPGGPKPVLAILVTWGVANLLIDEFPSDDGSSTTQTIFNGREISQLVGLTASDTNFASPTEADKINEAARRDRLYLGLFAFDAEALARHEKKLLWRSFQSIESHGNTLPDSLAIMLKSAAPFLGRNSAGPKFVDDLARLKAKVTLGESIILPDAPTPDKQP